MVGNVAVTGGEGAAPHTDSTLKAPSLTGNTDTILVVIKKNNKMGVVWVVETRRDVCTTIVERSLSEDFRSLLPLGNILCEGDK